MPCVIKGLISASTPVHTSIGMAVRQCALVHVDALAKRGSAAGIPLEN